MKLFYFCIMCLISVMAMGATIKVPDDYSTIQAAINASSNGDLILVEADTYVENIDFLGKAITVQSEDGPSTTIIDGGQNGSVVTFDSGEDNDSIINGFTITNGTGTSGRGGGIYCEASSPIIKKNIIYDNHASLDGGGITFYGRKYGVTAQVIDNIITNNSAFGTTFGCGGGIYTYSPRIDLINNIIYNNNAYNNGGAICCDHHTSSTNYRFFIVNNTIYDNEANKGGGIFCYDSIVGPTILNTIFWNDNATSGSEIYLAGIYNPSTLTISYSDVEGGQNAAYIEGSSTLNWGTGMIDSDPLFVDESGGDFHLTYTSPCKDAGDNSSVTESYDFEGDPRISYTTVDMGADEFYTHLYLVDDTLYFIGVPSSSATLYFGYTLLSTPISTIYGAWYLGTPFYGPYSMGTIPASGVISFEIDTTDLSPGSLYLQALIGSQLTNYCELVIE